MVKKYKPPRNRMEQFVRDSLSSIGGCCGANKMSIRWFSRKDIQSHMLKPDHHRIILAYGRVGKQQDKDGIQIKHVKTQNGPVTVRTKYEW